jgi:hypothetical protein
LLISWFLEGASCVSGTNKSGAFRHSRFQVTNFVDNIFLVEIAGSLSHTLEKWLLDWVLLQEMGQDL